MMRTRAFAAAAICVLAFLSGCESSLPPTLDSASIRWVTYRNSSPGYTMSYPDAYTIGANADATYVAFRYGRFMPVIVRFVDEQEGRRSGLWFASTPVEQIQLGGQPGEKYVYTHYDGPFGARMVAYVIPYKGKFLGLELRSNGELDDTQKAIVDGLRLLD